MKRLKPPKPSRSLTFCLIACALLIVCAFAVSSQEPTKKRGPIDWIFVLDTSDSMRGVGGSKNIFSNVKSTLGNFIQKTREGDSVAIYTFDRAAALRNKVQISGDLDRNDLLGTINGLEAEGKYTHIGEAIRVALERATELKKHPDASKRTVSIVLLSDGKEYTKGIPNPTSIQSNLSKLSQFSSDPPYIFYVALGGVAPDQGVTDLLDDPAIKNRTEVMTAPGPEEIGQLPDRIAKQIENPAPPPPPPEIKLTVEPASLDFGQIEPGENTSGQTLKVSSNAATSARLTLEDPANSGISLVEPQETIELRAGDSNAVKVRLNAAPGIADGSRTLRLVVTPVNTPPDTITKPVAANAQLNVFRVPIWRKALKWIALLLLLLILAAVAFWVIKGESPKTIWDPQKKYLEGEIEVLKPRPAQAEDEFVSLLQRESKSLRLSSLVPDGATADSDAELIATRKNGQKKTHLRRTHGAVYVNKAEVADIELFDGDIIELGEAHLRFNWIGHERPSDSDENI